MSHSPRDISQRLQLEKLNKQLARFQTHWATYMVNYETPVVYKLSTNHKKKETSEDVGTFPQNVAEFYWVYCNPAEDKFYGLCRLQCGLYAYFRIVEYGVATFLEERASKLIVSPSREELIEHAMSSTAYKKYIKKTVPV